MEGEIGAGLLVLLGIAHADTRVLGDRLAQKITRLRIFDDEQGRMNRDVLATAGAVLCVSQFTLFGDVRRGTRPSFDAAAPAEQARDLYELFCQSIAARGVRCERGVFGARMEIALVNDGPVTLIIDTDDLSRPRRA